MAFHKPLRLQQGASDLKNSQGLKFQRGQSYGGFYRVWQGSSTISHLFWDGTVFTAMSQNGAVANSYDGITWTTNPGLLRISGELGGRISGPMAGGNRYLLLPDTNNTYFSDDGGITWKYYEGGIGDPGGSGLSNSGTFAHKGVYHNNRWFWTQSSGLSMIRSRAEKFNGPGISNDTAFWGPRYSLDNPVKFNGIDLTKYGSFSSIGMIATNGSVLIVTGDGSNQYFYSTNATAANADANTINWSASRIPGATRNESTLPDGNWIPTQLSGQRYAPQIIKAGKGNEFAKVTQGYYDFPLRSYPAFGKSSNGVDWIEHAMAYDMLSLASNGTTLVAGGKFSALYTSPINDTENWTYRPNFRGIETPRFGLYSGAPTVTGGILWDTTTGAILVGTTSGMMRSTDGGDTWEFKLADGFIFSDITKDPDTGHIYAISQESSLRKSTDGGATWSGRLDQLPTYIGPQANNGSDFRSLARGPGGAGATAVAVAGPRILYSTGDAVPWKVANNAQTATWEPFPGLPTNSNTTRTQFYKVRYLNGGFVVVGSRGSIVSSVNGQTGWTVSTGLSGNANWGTNYAIMDIAFGGGRYVVIGGTDDTADGYDPNVTAPAPAKTAWSTDLTNWTVVNLPDWKEFVVEATAFYGYTKLTAGRAITYTGSQFVIAGTAGRIATSADGSAWTEQPNLRNGLFGDKPAIYNITSRGTTGQVTVGGHYGKMAVSANNGSTWTYKRNLSDEVWGETTVSGDSYSGVTSVIHDGSKFVALSKFGQISTSADGINWTYLGNHLGVRFNLTDLEFLSISYGAGTYVTATRGSAPINGQTHTRQPKFFKSTDLVNWTQFTLLEDPAINTTPVPSTVADTFKGGVVPSEIIYANGRWVIVFLFGSSVAESTDLVNWTLTSLLLVGPAVDNNPRPQLVYVSGLNRFIYATNLYGGPSKIGTSPPGTMVVPGTTDASNVVGTNPNQWTTVNSPAATSEGAWSALAANGTDIVLMSDGGSIYTSTNGADWTKRTTPGAFTQPRRMIYAGGRFIAVGAGGRVIRSNDSSGTSWTYYDCLGDIFWVPPIQNYRHCRRVEDLHWDGVNYVAVGEGGIAATSPDGKQWTDRPSLRNLPEWSYTSKTPNYKQWAANAYRVSGSSTRLAVIGDNGRAAYSSDNGATWQNTNSLFNTYWSQRDCNVFMWDGVDRIVVAGSKGKVAYADAKTILSPAFPNYLYQSSVANRKPEYPTDTFNPHDGFINCGWGDTSDVLCGLWDGTKFVVAGENGKVANSYINTNHPNTIADGHGYAWQNQTSLSDSGWGTGAVRGMVRRDDGLISVVGDGGRVATSTNGTTWAYHGVSTGVTYRGVAYGNNRFVAIGDNSVAATSPDGIAWTLQQASLQAAWGGSFTARAIAYDTGNNTTFVAIGDGGKVATSPDGVTWTARTLPSQWGTDSVRCIFWNGNRFHIGGDSGKLAISDDGITWIYSSGFIDKTPGYVNEFNQGVEGMDVSINVIGSMRNRLFIGTTGHPGTLANRVIMGHSVY